MRDPSSRKNQGQVRLLVRRPTLTVGTPEFTAFLPSMIVRLSEPSPRPRGSASASMPEGGGQKGGGGGGDRQHAVSVNASRIFLVPRGQADSPFASEHYTVHP